MFTKVLVMLSRLVFAVTVVGCGRPAAAIGDAPSPSETPAVGGAQAAASDEPPVLVYDIEPSGESLARPTGPRLQVFGDGRVRVHDPHGHPLRDRRGSGHVDLVEGRITRQELAVLVDAIAAGATFEGLQTETVDPREEDAVMMDAATTHFTLRRGGRTHAVQVYDLPSSSPDPGMQHLIAVAARLEALRRRVVDGGR